MKGAAAFQSYDSERLITLRAESPSIFQEKSGRSECTLLDFSRKIEGDSARRVVYVRVYVSIGVTRLMSVGYITFAVGKHHACECCH